MFDRSDSSAGPSMGEPIRDGEQVRNPSTDPSEFGRNRAKFCRSHPHTKPNSGKSWPAGTWSRRKSCAIARNPIGSRPRWRITEVAPWDGAFLRCECLQQAAFPTSHFLTVPVSQNGGPGA